MLLALVFVEDACADEAEAVDVSELRSKLS
jgi:hypothetical protein